MLAYHILSPASSIEEDGLMTYLQSPPDAGPSVSQATAGLKNWKCAGRRLVQIGGRLPTANQLRQSFVKILSKHLTANKKVSFAFQQKSSTMPIMNPSPTKIVELFTVVEVTLVQYATVAGHFPGVAAAAVKKTKSRKANKVDFVVEEQPKEDFEVCAVTPGPKSKGPRRGSPPTSPPKTDLKPPEAKKGGKGGEGKRSKSEPRPENESSSAYCSTGESAKREITVHCNYEHQVDSNGNLVPVGPEILQKYDDAVKIENKAQAKAKSAFKGGVGVRGVSA